MSIRGSRFIACLALSLLLSNEMQASSYGFGLLRKNVTVTRRLVPEVQLSDVSITIGFPGGTKGLDDHQFVPIFKNLLAQGGRDLSIVDRNAPYDLQLNITNFVRPGVDRKTEGKSTTYTEVGSASVVMQLVHHADGQIILSRTEMADVGGGASPSANKSFFGVQMPKISSANDKTTNDSVATKLYNTLAVKIASHLVILPEDVALPLAKGPGLDEANKLAEAKRWTQYLEQISTMSPASSPADDAYRLYDIGVANEALGYESDDPKVTLKLLREASINYSKAMEANSSEKYFTVAQGRIESALSRYTTLDERKKETDRLAAADVQAQKEYDAKKKAGGIDNSDIIKLCRAHLDPSIIVTRIRTAKIADFDLSTDGLVELAQAGVPAAIINEMTIRMSSGPSAPPTSTTGRPRGGPQR